MKITKALTRLTGSASASSASSDSSPVFVLLHGWGSNEYDLPDLLNYCGAGSADFASLQAPIAYGMGYTWFGDWAHEGVPEGESLTRQAYDAAAAIDEWVKANIPADCTVVTMGFSQGGLLAAHMLRFDPARYAAAVSFSGWLAPGVMDGDKALEASQPPVFYGHGSIDDIFPAADVAAMSAFWRAHGTLSEHIYPGMAHSINMDELRDVRRFLESHDLIRPQIP
ncbi:phospholipase [Bifidobacterium rousetti]|uniref:alpha/beta hydrolase n=1 Tax=Bifidobacterium rousetti TaxID=2045439 RepID=UPI001238DC09|nr:dienelactone hydrolase family protein [Bifidobacterium rousetti]KAA8819445.1 phospholipase [Bifidobacterium rousetti]